MPQSVCRCRACAERDTSAGRSTTISDSPFAESEDAEEGCTDDAEAVADVVGNEEEDEDDADEEAVDSLVAKWRAMASSMASAFALWCSHDGALECFGGRKHTLTNSATEYNEIIYNIL